MYINNIQIDILMKIINEDIFEEIISQILYCIIVEENNDILQLLILLYKRICEILSKDFVVLLNINRILIIKY